MTTLTYPITVANGGLQLTSEYPEKVAETIVHVLSTVQEERVYRPEFGRDIDAFRLATDISTILRSLEATIATGLEEYPGVTFRLVGTIGDDGRLEATCYYQFDDLSDSVSVVL